MLVVEFECINSLSFFFFESIEKKVNKKITTDFVDFWFGKQVISITKKNSASKCLKTIWSEFSNLAVEKFHKMCARLFFHTILLFNIEKKKY